VACDAHPGYLSHQLARSLAGPVRVVPHHLAHGLAVMAEHALPPPLLVVAFDGLGYAPGPGLALRGGECLLIAPDGEQHLAGLRPFPLPGGEVAMEEPRRTALGLLAATERWHHPGAVHTRAAFRSDEAELLQAAVAAGCNTPPCSSVGRLFDAVASLLGLCQHLGHEGEAGLRLEGAAEMARGLPGSPQPSPYPLPLRSGEASDGGESDGRPVLGWLDWQPLIEALLGDLARGEAPALCSLRFHHALAAAIVGVALDSAGTLPSLQQVALAGGCFQNRLLLEATIGALRQAGFHPFWSERIPCNDGGLAAGQILAVRRNQHLGLEPVTPVVPPQDRAHDAVSGTPW
jgi:hydrogenase maturation protein HypF